MARKLLCAMVVAAILASQSGCGTVANLNATGRSRPRPYGGVAADLAVCRESLEPTRIHGWFPGFFLVDRTVAVVTCGFFLLDLPLSAVGDTLTLPLILRSSEGTATGSSADDALKTPREAAHEEPQLMPGH